MARSIAVNSTEAWRAVIVLKVQHGPNAGRIDYKYEGLYDKQSTARGRVSYWKNYSAQFYDGWAERAVIEWEKVKD